MKIYLFINFVLLFILISCNKDKYFEPDLIGKWNWTSTCGGFSGACLYPNSNESMKVEVTNFKIVKKVNDSTLLNSQYTVKNKMIYEKFITQEMVLENGKVLRIILTTDALEIENGDTWENYKKVNN